MIYVQTEKVKVLFKRVYEWARRPLDFRIDLGTITISEEILASHVHFFLLSSHDVLHEFFLIWLSCLFCSTFNLCLRFSFIDKEPKLFFNSFLIIFIFFSLHHSFLIRIERMKKFSGLGLWDFFLTRIINFHFFKIFGGLLSLLILFFIRILNHLHIVSISASHFSICGAMVEILGESALPSEYSRILFLLIQIVN